MAKTTIVQITDDLDGSKGAQTVSFAFQGTDYTIDLSKKNLTAFEKALKPFLEVATKAPRRPATRGSGSKKTAAGPDLASVREWARGQGIEVSDRGRVARSVVEQYEAALGG